MKYEPTHASARISWQQFATLFLVALVLALPALFLLVGGSAEFGDWSKPILYSFMALTVLVLLGLWRPSIALLICAPFMLAAPLESLYIIHYRQASGYEIFASALETNLAEAIEMLGLTNLALLGLVCAAGISACLWLAWRLRHYKGSKTSLLISFSAFCVAAKWSVQTISSLAWALEDQSLSWKFRNNDVPPHLQDISRSFPAGLVPRVVTALVERRRVQRLRLTSQTMRFGATQDVIARSLPQVHVLVIGETVRAANWQLNGYHEATTPLLKERSNVISFPDMISHWNITRRSVPQILTRRDPRYRSDAFHEPSLVTTFKEAGFHTIWLSNQRRVGEHDSVIGMFAQEAVISRFFSLGHWRQANATDAILVKPLADALRNNPETDVFVVVHLMGSHYNYSLRYPSSFQSESGTTVRLLNDDNLRVDKAADVLKAYDTSIAYTDFVLSQFMDAIVRDGRAASLFYISDHGEDLISNECGLANHGNPTRFNFHVPAFAWVSPAYLRVFPDKVAALRRNANKPLASSMVWSTVVGMAGITLNDSTASLDISAEVLSSPIRWVNLPRSVDFDRATVSGPCQLISSPE